MIYIVIDEIVPKANEINSHFSKSRDDKWNFIRFAFHKLLIKF